MAQTEMDKESPSMRPHGDVLKTPGENGPDNSRPPGDPDVGVPPKPGGPLPRPENPDTPGSPPEPSEPGQGQPIPPELDSPKAAP